MGYYRHPVVGFATNFGYFYCPKHGVDKPGALGEKAGKPHEIVMTVRGDDGWEGTYCDWPSCKDRVPPQGKPTEYVDESLHSNLLNGNH